MKVAASKVENIEEIRSLPKGLNMEASHLPARVGVKLGEGTLKGITNVVGSRPNSGTNKNIGPLEKGKEKCGLNTKVVKKGSDMEGRPRLPLKHQSNPITRVNPGL